MPEVSPTVTQSRDKTFYTKEGYKKCQICGGPIEKIPYPHFHIIEDKTVNIVKDWETKMRHWVRSNLWSL